MINSMESKILISFSPSRTNVTVRLAPVSIANVKIASKLLTLWRY